MTKFVFRSDPAWVGKGKNLDRWLKLGNALFGGVCVCVSLGSSAAHACAGEETCGEEKKGVGVRARDVAKTISTRERLGTSQGCGFPRQTTVPSIPVSPAVMLCTLKAYLPRRGFGPGWRAAPGRVHGGLLASSWEDQAAGQGRHQISSRSEQGSAHSPRSALSIHYLAQSSLAPLCVRPPLPQLLPSSSHSSFLLPSKGLLLPPLTFPWMQAALTDCRIACREHRTFLLPRAQHSASLSLPDRTAWAVFSQDLVPQIITGAQSGLFPSALPPAQHHSCGGPLVEMPALYLWGFDAEITHVQWQGCGAITPVLLNGMLFLEETNVICILSFNAGGGEKNQKN